MKEYQENVKKQKQKRSQSQQVQRKSKGNLELTEEVNQLEETKKQADSQKGVDENTEEYKIQKNQEALAEQANFAR